MRHGAYEYPIARSRSMSIRSLPAAATTSAPRSASGAMAASNAASHDAWYGGAGPVGTKPGAYRPPSDTLTTCAPMRAA
eukprot:366456-Chlamydomonas_euryale.AAC.3